jgi:hypothetical protein
LMDRLHNWFHHGGCCDSCCDTGCNGGCGK